MVTILTSIVLLYRMSLCSLRPDLTFHLGQKWGWAYKRGNSLKVVYNPTTDVYVRLWGQNRGCAYRRGGRKSLCDSHTHTHAHTHFHTHTHTPQSVSLSHSHLTHTFTHYPGIPREKHADTIGASVTPQTTSNGVALDLLEGEVIIGSRRSKSKSLSPEKESTSVSSQRDSR